MAKRRNGFFADRERQRQERQREQARFQRENERLARQGQRERERLERDQRRQEEQEAKQQRVEHVAGQQALAARENDALRARLDELGTLLVTVLRAGSGLTFDSLRRSVRPVPFDAAGLDIAEPAPAWADFAPPSPSALMKRFAPRRGDAAVQSAMIRFERAQQDHRGREQIRLQRLAEAEERHAAAEQSRQRAAGLANDKVDALESGVREGRAPEVERFMTMALKSSRLPASLPNRVEVAYLPDARRLLVVRDVPTVEVIPAVREYSYVRTKDEIVERARPVKELRDRYADLIAQIALRTLYEAFRVRPSELILEAAVSAHVSTRNKATGRPERPCLVSVQATRQQFSELVLTDLDPKECLRHLKAIMSAHPHDLEPVRPVFDPDLSRYRFINAHDAAAGLDSRSALLDMHPSEFEQLIRQLFEAMGMKSWVTQPSRDDGVDAVAVNEDPIMGGTCVIQAKRYRNTVEPDAVRALAGVMDHKRASRGVLVTTSWFGKTSHQFAEDHGRIQLIEGDELKYMLLEFLELDVVIGELKRRRR